MVLLKYVKNNFNLNIKLKEEIKMKWLKYPMQTIVMLTPFFLITLFISVGIYCPFLLNIILIVFFVWLIKNDEIPFWFGWKKEHRQKFFKNWDAMCDGKTNKR